MALLVRREARGLQVRLDQLDRVALVLRVLQGLVVVGLLVLLGHRATQDLLAQQERKVIRARRDRLGRKALRDQQVPQAVKAQLDRQAHRVIKET